MSAAPRGVLLSSSSFFSYPGEEKLDQAEHFADLSAGPAVPGKDLWTNSCPDAEKFAVDTDQTSKRELKEVADLPVPEELLVSKHVGPGRPNAAAGVSLVLTWFYDEEMLEQLGDPTSPVKGLYFEVKQQSQVANGRLRTRLHTCGVHLSGSGEAVRDQRFVIDGCSAGRTYTFNVRALVDIEALECIVASNWSSAVETLVDDGAVPNACIAALDAASSITAAVASSPTVVPDGDQGAKKSGATEQELLASGQLLSEALELGRRTLKELKEERMRQLAAEHRAQSNLEIAGAQGVQALQEIGDRSVEGLFLAADDLERKAIPPPRFETIEEAAEESLDQSPSPRRETAAETELQFTSTVLEADEISGQSEVVAEAQQNQEVFVAAAPSPRGVDEKQLPAYMEPPPVSAWERRPSSCNSGMPDAPVMEQHPRRPANDARALVRATSVGELPSRPAGGGSMTLQPRFASVACAVPQKELPSSVVRIGSQSPARSQAVQAVGIAACSGSFAPVRNAGASPTRRISGVGSANLPVGGSTVSAQIAEAKQLVAQLNSRRMANAHAAVLAGMEHVSCGSPMKPVRSRSATPSPALPGSTLAVVACPTPGDGSRPTTMTGRAAIAGRPIPAGRQSGLSYPGSPMQSRRVSRAASPRGNWSQPQPSVQSTPRQTPVASVAAPPPPARSKAAPWTWSQSPTRPGGSQPLMTSPPPAAQVRACSPEARPPPNVHTGAYQVSPRLFGPAVSPSHGYRQVAARSPPMTQTAPWLGAPRTTIPTPHRPVIAAVASSPLAAPSMPASTRGRRW